mmetsp:Transcript_17808/g.53721  ORF Transcript_17808/g.53721 Transcript_17808/m.53721 type:complete len:569 (+) Transcript_17808:360-2066(+)
MCFNLVIWRPRNWIVRPVKTVRGETRYTVERARVWRVTTRTPGWRLHLLVVWCAQAFNNGCWALTASLVYGPLGVKALLCRHTFHPQMRLDDRTGQLETDTDFTVQTLCSRLAALWEGIWKSREAFEATPDRGLLGKSITRVCNVAWNYVFRGFVGTCLVVIGQPVLTVLSVLFSLVMLATPMLWAPIAALLFYVFCMLVYDPMGPRDHAYSCFGLLCGLVLIAAGLIELLICLLLLLLLPVLNALLACLRLLHNLLWWLYDTVMFCLVIRCARVPDTDSFVCRRTSGPGLSAGFYYQVSPAIALVALQHQLELFELQLRESRLRRLAAQPEQELKLALSRFVGGPLGVGDLLSVGPEDGKPAAVESLPGRLDELRKAHSKAAEKITAAFQGRREELQRHCRLPQAGRVRQSQADAERVQRLGALVVRSFVERRWLPLLSEVQAAEFWEARDLAAGDWAGLARCLLEQAFSKDFFASTFETMDAAGFSLEVAHAGLEDLVSSLVEADASVQDPLTRVTPMCPRGADSSRLRPEVALEDIPAGEPRVPAEALRKVLRREDGWGRGAAAA